MAVFYFIEYYQGIPHCDVVPWLEISVFLRQISGMAPMRKAVITVDPKMSGGELDASFGSCVIATGILKLVGIV